MRGDRWWHEAGRSSPWSGGSWAFSSNQIASEKIVLCLSIRTHKFSSCFFVKKHKQLKKSNRHDIVQISDDHIIWRHDRVQWRSSGFFHNRAYAHLMPLFSNPVSPPLCLMVYVEELAIWLAFVVSSRDINGRCRANVKHLLLRVLLCISFKRLHDLVSFRYVRSNLCALHHKKDGKSSCVLYIWKFMVSSQIYVLRRCQPMAGFHMDEMGLYSPSRVFPVVWVITYATSFK